MLRTLRFASSDVSNLFHWFSDFTAKRGKKARATDIFIENGSRWSESKRCYEKFYSFIGKFIGGKKEKTHLWRQVTISQSLLFAILVKRWKDSNWHHWERQQIGKERRWKCREESRWKRSIKFSAEGGKKRRWKRSKKRLRNIILKPFRERKEIGDIVGGGIIISQIIQLKDQLVEQIRLE